MSEPFEYIENDTNIAEQIRKNDDTMTFLSSIRTNLTHLLQANKIELPCTIDDIVNKGGLGYRKKPDLIKNEKIIFVETTNQEYLMMINPEKTGKEIRYIDINGESDRVGFISLRNIKKRGKFKQLMNETNTSEMIIDALKGIKERIPARNKDSSETGENASNNKDWKSFIRNHKKGVGITAGILVVAAKLFSYSNQQVDANVDSKYGTIAYIDADSDLGIEEGASVVQTQNGKTYVLTNEGAIELKRSDLKNMDIIWVQEAEIRANEAKVYVYKQDGEKTGVILPEAAKLIVLPESGQNGMYHVIVKKTGKEGYVPKEFIKFRGDKDFSSGDWCIVYYNKQIPLRLSADIDYRDREEKKIDEVIGYLGGEDEEGIAIAIQDKTDPNYLQYMGLPNANISFSDVYKVYHVRSNGLEKCLNTDDLLYDRNEEIEIDDGCYAFGIIANEDVVGEGIFSSGKTVEPGSWFFQFTDRRMAITEDGLVNVNASDMKDLKVNFLRKANIIGQGYSVLVIGKEKGDGDGEVLDGDTVTLLPIENQGSFVLIVDPRTEKPGLVAEEHIGHPKVEQNEVQDTFVAEVVENTDVKTTKQTKEEYIGNKKGTIKKGSWIIVERDDEDTEDIYTVKYADDYTLTGGYIKGDKIKKLYKITSERLEEIEEEKNDNLSSSQSFRKEMQLVNSLSDEEQADVFGTFAVIEDQEEPKKEERARAEI